MPSRLRARLTDETGRRTGSRAGLRSAVVTLLMASTLGAPALGSETRVRELIDQAQAAAAAKDSPGAYKAIRAAIADPDFTRLASSMQHSALESAYVSAYNARDFGQAHEYAQRATALPQQNAKDWSYRLQSAFELRDRRDEALSIAGGSHLAGDGVHRYTLETVERVFRDTQAPDLADARKAMLLALYDTHWLPEDGETASNLWLALSLMLMDGGDTAKAIQVLGLVDVPADIILMHADRRYQSLLKASHTQLDARQAAMSKMKMLRLSWAHHPRSLDTLLRLSSELLESSMADQEVLDLTTEADRKITTAAKDNPPFDDLGDNHAWILDNKARALQRLGRFDEAVVEIRRAMELPHDSDAVSVPINAALLLCGMGRLDDAVSVVPKMDNASEYGKTQIVLIGLMAAAQRKDQTLVDPLLAYLDDHRLASPETYQRALLIGGKFDLAEKFLVSRLADPEQRGAALMELQTYAERRRAPVDRTWNAEFERLKASPKVRQAVDQVGAIGQYTWRYDPES